MLRNLLIAGVYIRTKRICSKQNLLYVLLLRLLQELAGSIFQSCNEAIEKETGAPYELSHYPIEEYQRRAHEVERQMSHR